MYFRVWCARVCFFSEKRGIKKDYKISLADFELHTNARTLIQCNYIQELGTTAILYPHHQVVRSSYSPVKPDIFIHAKQLCSIPSVNSFIDLNALSREAKSVV